jgi:hypothetical protein
MPTKKSNKMRAKTFKNKKKSINKKAFIAIFVALVVIAGIFVVYRSFASNYKESSFNPIIPNRIIDSRLDITKPFKPGEKRSIPSSKLIKASLNTTRGGRPGLDEALANEELTGATGLVFNVTISNPKSSQNAKIPVTISLKGTDSKVTVFTESNKSVTKKVILPINKSFQESFPDITYEYSGNSTTSLDLIVDYIGIYSTRSYSNPQKLKSFSTPILNYDTRANSSPILANQTREISTDEACRTNCSALPQFNTMVVNVTAVNPLSNGFLKIWSGNNEPNTVDLNFQAGSSATNQTLLIIRRGENIKIKSSSNTDLILSVSGLYQSTNSLARNTFIRTGNPNKAIYERVDITKLITNPRTINVNSKYKALILNIESKKGAGFMKSSGNTVLNSSGGYSSSQFIAPVVNGRVQLEIYPTSKTNDNNEFINPDINIEGYTY